MKATMLRPRVIVLLLGLATVASSCGSDTTDPGSNNNNNNNNSNNTQSCMVTLSGAQTGSPICSKVAAVWTSNGNSTGVGLDAAGGGDTVGVAVSFSGEPTVTTYTVGTGAVAALSVVNASTVWTANFPTASWSLTISSVSTTSSGGGYKDYAVHGTLRATLQPNFVTTPIGPVTVTATF